MKLIKKHKAGVIILGLISLKIIIDSMLIASLIASSISITVITGLIMGFIMILLITELLKIEEQRLVNTEAKQNA